ncbi:hypothetical protein PSTT_07621 [Puccinia striiformis]|uniref:Uncharacterized protein n=1 Tax=Puccinia striiformis TaxID=27350 RepID=A0A2S4VFN0_9BASI|nr:hypothetical protein PSTT_07621 [Puccinia striiformis]
MVLLVDKMNLLLSSVLPFLVFQAIMGIDLSSRNLNKFKSRSIHPNEALEWSSGAPPPPDCCG